MSFEDSMKIQRTPGEEKKLTEKRKAHEDQVRKEVKMTGGRLNRMGIGVGKKAKEIIQVDALREKELRETLNDFPSEGNKQSLETAEKSTLSFKRGRLENGFKTETIFGVIDGKKVELLFVIAPTYTTIPDKYSGTIDGQELSPEEAKEMFREYIVTAAKRSEGKFPDRDEIVTSDTGFKHYGAGPLRGYDD